MPAARAATPARLNAMTAQPSPAWLATNFPDVKRAKGPLLQFSDDLLDDRRFTMPMRTLRAERQLAMLFVTHNIALSRHIADNLAVLNKGKIVDYGPTAQVLENPTHEYTRAPISDVPKF
jgi:hypothetical protein